ncbi:MAG: hypothetical protein Tsb0032_26330 [Kiloniellaceae bacterium]
MTKRSHVLAAGLSAALALPLLLTTGPAAAACEKQVEEVIQSLPMQQNDVESMKVVRRSAGARASNNYTYDAWIKLNSCNGHLVVHMTRSCMVQDSYTTGDCKVGNLPQF